MGKKDISLFSIRIESGIYAYVNWILMLNWFFSFTFSLLIITIFFSFYFIELDVLYNILKVHKKIIIFLLVIIIFLFIPSNYEFLFQISIVLLVLLSYELLLFFSCIKLFQLKKM